MKKLLILVLFFIMAFANEKTVKLSEFYPSTSYLQGMRGYADITIPVPNRIKIKKALLHIEYIPSKALVAQRSVIRISLNDVTIFQQRLDSAVDMYSYNIRVPLYLIKEFNKLKITASQHYCMNCCENPSSPELWTEILWKKSYLKLDYDYKDVNATLINYRDYVLDYKNFSPIKIGIMTQGKDRAYLTMGARISGYLGSVIKYRKIYVCDVRDLNTSADLFLLGNKEYVKRVLNLKTDVKDIPDVFVLPNPYDSKKAVMVLSAEDKYKLKDIVDSFISIPKNLIVGKSMDVERYKKPALEAYESPLYIPLGKKVYFKDLGYGDLKFYNPLYQYDIKFNIPPDVFLISQKKFTLHLYYNYNSAVEKASAINVFLNGKFITALKIKDNYGTLLEDVKLKIPVYMLNKGENKITIQYALQAPGAGYCKDRNYRLLQGTVFSDKSYIQMPDFSHWTEMAYLHLFTSSAYPFSMYPDLRDTQIYLSHVTPKLVSSLYTLCAYMGEKTLVPLYNVNVVTSKGDIGKESNVIALGSDLPKEFFENMPIKFDANYITLKYDAFKKIEDTLKRRFFNKEKNGNLKTILKMKDDLIDQTVITEGQSPYSQDKTFMIITSKKDTDILNTVKNLYKPKFSGNIKGDLVVVDNENDKVYYADIGKKYYVGHLTLFEYVMFKIGFSYTYMIFMFLAVAVLIVIMLKFLLDRRKK
jgi:hypothetical protein